MSRTPPNSPPEIKLKQNDLITEERTYAIITPLFGGGVEPREADPISVVRASEVRGQLRFWWRATRGGQFGNELTAMRDAEEALWGGPAREKEGKTVGHQSVVQVFVEPINVGIDDIPFEVRRKGRDWKSEPRDESMSPSYAAFSLQPTEQELRNWNIGKQPKAVRANVSFTLAITYPEQKKLDVEAALWAWETFGGLGARTRRGFGALRLMKVGERVPKDVMPGDAVKAHRWLTSRLEYFIPEEANQWPEDVPHLLRKIRLKITRKAEGDPIDEWHILINALKRFRQSRRNKHTGKDDPYGHSNWPEPNAIRGMFKKPQRGPHERRVLPRFPRAQFGLPIVFHLPHDSTLDDVTLQGFTKTALRLASPLILKPVACSGGQALGLAVILEGTRVPTQLMLDGAPASSAGHSPLIEPYLSQDEAKLIPPLKRNVDVLQAFLDIL